MRYSVTFFIAICLAFPSSADDSARNPVAAKIKKQLQTKVNKNFNSYEGYCDLVIYLEHTDKYAIVKRVSGIGDQKVCRAGKTYLKIGSRYRYRQAESMLVIHLSTLR
ncbi:hypothetical protein [Vibrio navarrensis]|uniref:hypothetical protein n=1 Tax=Vibrio navarrensis TaxID=29495 RepID=UPI00051D23E2|nr:hypothetical protein [Vibrio navarrensis]KGK16946.1 hypothetical protein EA24_13470 [Vibrio navarrensis]